MVESVNIGAQGPDERQSDQESGLKLPSLRETGLLNWASTQQQRDFFKTLSYGQANTTSSTSAGIPFMERDHSKLPQVQYASQQTFSAAPAPSQPLEYGQQLPRVAIPRLGGSGTAAAIAAAHRYPGTTSHKPPRTHHYLPNREQYFPFHYQSQQPQPQPQQHQHQHQHQQESRDIRRQSMLNSQSAGQLPGLPKHPQSALTNYAVPQYGQSSLSPLQRPDVEQPPSHPQAKKPYTYFNQGSIDMLVAAADSSQPPLPPPSSSLPSVLYHHGDDALSASADRENITYRFVCKYTGCNKSFPSKSRLQRHELVHTGSKPFACLFPSCSRTFSRRDNMLQHYRTHVVKIPPSR